MPIHCVLFQQALLSSPIDSTTIVPPPPPLYLMLNKVSLAYFPPPSDLTVNILHLWHCISCFLRSTTVILLKQRVKQRSHNNIYTLELHCYNSHKPVPSRQPTSSNTQAPSLRGYVLGETSVHFSNETVNSVVVKYSQNLKKYPL